MAKTILVTGGTGYLGSNVLEHLHEKGTPFVYSFLTEPHPAYPTEGLRMNLLDPEDMADHTELVHATYLIHTAASVGHVLDGQTADDIHRHVTTNVIMLENLIRHLPNLERIVFVSSCSAEIAERDPSYYGIGKRVLEEVIHHLTGRQIHTVILRFPQLFGPGEPHGTFVTKFVRALLVGEPITLINGGALVRDIVYVKEAANAAVFATASPKTGTFTITDQPRTVKDIYEMLARLSGKTNPVVRHEQIPEEELAKKSFHCDDDLAELGYRFRYTLEEGLKATIEQMEK